MDDNDQVFQNYGSSCENELNSKQTNAKPHRILFKYSWTIQLQGDPKVISPEFPNRAYSGITWYLTLHVFDNAMWPKCTIGVQLSLASCNVQNVNADYRITLRNCQGLKIGNLIEAPNKLFKLNEPLNAFDFIQLYSQNYYSMPSNKLTVECEIAVEISEVHPVPHQNVSENQKKLTLQLTEKLLAMFENEEFSDVTFSVNGRELKAHKVILAAGSSVFKVMLEQEMMERKPNRIEINDIEFEVLRELIRFIYTKEVSNLEKIAKELLVASDKYDLEELKNMCESVLCQNISTENVAEMFIFADTYNVVFLKVIAKQYIVSHSKDVSNTNEWKSMIMTHPHLIAEAFIALSDKQQSFSKRKPRIKNFNN